MNKESMTNRGKTKVENKKDERGCREEEKKHLRIKHHTRVNVCGEKINFESKKRNLTYDETMRMHRNGDDDNIDTIRKD